MGQAEQGDLGPHQCAVGLVEVQQLQAVIVAGVLQVLADQAPGKRLEATVFQVHGDEGDIGVDIGEAEGLVELDAIEEHHLAVDQGGVAQVDVTVAFADEAFLLAPRQ
ncbi:hypothetical protein D9M71_435290 [compost metagenome]